MWFLTVETPKILEDAHTVTLGENLFFACNWPNNVKETN